MTARLSETVAVVLVLGVIVSGAQATAPPPGAAGLAVEWIRVAAPGGGGMLAAVARPDGAGPFPAVLVLHGTHGFAREYVQWARELADAGFLTVAACWFSGGGGGGAKAVSPPIACPDIPPLGPGEYREGLPYVDALVQATRRLPGAKLDRLALIGHSRGGGMTMQYVLAKGQVQAAVVHSSGYALQPAARAAEFTAPILVLHGTGDGPTDGGGPNTRVGLAREFEAALRRQGRPVDAHYYAAGTHASFFTNPAQHAAELREMIAFLRRQLGS